MELSPVTVAGRTRDCLKLLGSSIDAVSNEEGDRRSFAAAAQQSLASLNRWADNAGVFAPSSASLDYQLREVPHLVCALLVFMTDSDTNGIHSTNDTISWLNRFSRVIRTSGTRDHFSRAAKFPLTDSEGNDISESFEQSVRRALSIQLELKSGRLFEKLVAGIVLRRRRFLCTRSHQNKRQRRDPEKVFLKRTSETDSAQSTKKPPKEGLSAIEIGTISATPATDTTALRHGAADASTAASTRSVPQEHFQFPPPLPKHSLKCPYCCLILPAEVYTDVDKWKRHVIRDIRPYVCIYEDCPYPEEYFSSTREWHQHLRKPHHTEWVCPLFDQCDVSALGHRHWSFDSQKALESHLLKEHDHPFSLAQISILSRRSTRTGSRLTQCPLCNWPSSLDLGPAITEDEYHLRELDIFEHVSQHLLNAALISFPPRNDINVESDEESITVLFGKEKRKLKTSDESKVAFRGLLHGEPATNLPETSAFFGKTGDRERRPEARLSHQSIMRGSRSTLTRQWFQPGEGIAREVITADIQRYLGLDAHVKLGIGMGEWEGEEGYWITAYRTVSSKMVQDLKLDTQRWRAEVQQGRVAYQDSRTHQSRQYYGPSSLSPGASYAPPSAAQVYADHPPSSGYRAPAQSSYGGGDYNYAQQGAHYVPAPGYGQGYVRTAPSYGYNLPPSREEEPNPSHYSSYQDPPRYGYPPPSHEPPEHVYTPPQPSTSQEYYYANSRSAATQPPPQAGDRRRRRPRE